MVSPWSNPDVTAQGFKFVIVSVEDSAEGAIQGKTLGDTVLQAETTTLTQHYGFSSEPPADTEQIGFTLRDGSVAAVAENVSRPDLSAEQVRIWDSKGNKITLKAGSNGIEIECQSGSKVQIHRGGTPVGIARLGDDVDMTEKLKTWIASVEAGVSAAGGSVTPPWGPTVTQIGDISTASSIAEAE